MAAACSGCGTAQLPVLPVQAGVQYLEALLLFMLETRYDHGHLSSPAVGCAKGTLVLTQQQLWLDLS
jgi:hypothetical protein